MSSTYNDVHADTLIGAALAPLDWTRSVSLVVAFSLLTALAAQIVIPIGPVPITGSTFAGAANRSAAGFTSRRDGDDCIFG